MTRFLFSEKDQSTRLRNLFKKINEEIAGNENYVALYRIIEKKEKAEKKREDEEKKEEKKEKEKEEKEEKGIEEEKKKKWRNIREQEFNLLSRCYRQNQHWQQISDNFSDENQRIPEQKNVRWNAILLGETSTTRLPTNLSNDLSM
jgi:hypothetical protein